MQTYKLDPCWYFTTPALSWDAMLLHTKVAIELFTDYDMLLFIEKGVRGDESDVGYILEVDLEYPSDLHDKHSDFPLDPENKPPPNCKEPRLLTTLESKTKFVLHYSNLKLYLKLDYRKKTNSTRPLNSKIKANAGEKQLNSSVGTKQLNSTGENNSTRQHERNNSTGESNPTQQQEQTTQLVSRNETTQLCTAVDRLQPPAPPLQQNRLFLPTDMMMNINIQRKEFSIFQFREIYGFTVKPVNLNGPFFLFELTNPKDHS
ncbi:uncharacterized protein TNCV_885891 [Trichonephila clavipes]|nr:uncharacterized protein TNCV_885891 [Trichonephila clavipes]